MFLDDKLYQHTVDKKIRVPKDFQELINELYAICEDHFKPKLKPNMTYKDGTIEIDRVFNAWDLFVKRLEKDKYFLVEFIKKYSFKSTYLANERLKEIYLKGK